MTAAAKLKQEALSLNPQQRLRLAQDIWDSVVEEDPGSVQVPVSHRRIIDQRLEEHEANPQSSITLAEVKRRVRKHLADKRKRR